MKASKLLPLALLALPLIARENPFIPVEMPEENPSVASSEKIRSAKPDTQKKAVSVQKTSATAMSKTDGPSEERPSQVANFQNIRLVFSEGEVRIETKDALLKDFTIPKPPCIVLDFKSDADFPTRKRELSVAPFREVRMGIHKGFYRVALETEAPVEYTMKPFRYGYILTLRESD
jgi:hypothetical protein